MISITLAPIISVMDAPARYPGEKVIVVFCPHCREVHKHRGAQLSVRVARCDPGKEYLLTTWRKKNEKI
jgi:hypothetical protein